MNKRKIRDILRLCSAILFFWLYIPHLLIALFSSKQEIIFSDIQRMRHQIEFTMPLPITLLFFIHTNRYYRKLFYFRIGPIWQLLIGWWRPGDEYFNISALTKIGPGMLIAHPIATRISAQEIGSNFSCVHFTTIGKKGNKKAIIGNNVTLGANVTIIGGVHIGNNVTIGAGSVVVKDIPDNCIAAGNPAHIIRQIEK